MITERRCIVVLLQVVHLLLLCLDGPHEDNRLVTPVKCTKSAHRGTGTIYDSCRFDFGRFGVEPTYLRKLSYMSDTFAYRSAHNNNYGVIHKLKRSCEGHDVQFSGRIWGSVVLAKPGDYLDAFEGCCEDNSIKG